MDVARVLGFSGASGVVDLKRVGIIVAEVFGVRLEGNWDTDIEGVKHVDIWKEWNRIRCLRRREQQRKG